MDFRVPLYALYYLTCVGAEDPSLLCFLCQQKSVFPSDMWLNGFAVLKKGAL